MWSELMAVISKVSEADVTSNLLLNLKIVGASGFKDFSVNVKYVLAPRPFVEIVNVLSDDAHQVL
jgi:hypothetical protein